MAYFVPGARELCRYGLAGETARQPGDGKDIVV